MNLGKHRIQECKPIMLTPFMDVLTVLLIFLIVNFSPDETHIEVDAKIKLPESIHHLSQVPHFQVEISAESVKVNGEALAGLVPQQENSESWGALKAYITKNAVAKNEPVLLVADKDTSFRYIDRAAAHLSAAGFSELYFLTGMKESEMAGLLQ